MFSAPQRKKFFFKAISESNSAGAKCYRHAEREKKDQEKKGGCSLELRSKKQKHGKWEGVAGGTNKNVIKRGQFGKGLINLMIWFAEVS